MIEELKIVAEIMSGITDGAIYGLIGYFGYMLTSSILNYIGWCVILYIIGKGVIRILCDNGFLTPDKFEFQSHSWDKEQANRISNAIDKYTNLKNRSNGCWSGVELRYLADVLEEGLKNKPD